MPVIILADTSGSMAGQGKIDHLNQAIRKMIASFKEESAIGVSIKLAVIAFGGENAILHTPYSSVGWIEWKDLKANGKTPLGQGLVMLGKMLDEMTGITRSFRPNVVLVSDGIPTDNWQVPFHKIVNSKRSGKANRLAIGVGADADQKMLTEFVGGDATKVVSDHDASMIGQFFEYVTLTVVSQVTKMTDSTIGFEEWKEDLADDKF